ncbi:unnamed protein product [Rotaria sordida]|uniref:CHAT domain-containing protein n=1 Tax=Rotaria sordida TaxID=392033 RepID=A0A815XHA0_9BILA|nr:unnamed protein product [Rotaria sordida]CAF1557396.1 unnamed protein product [Rotaria sordida]
MCTTTYVGQGNEEYFGLPKATGDPLAEELHACAEKNIPCLLNEKITKTQLLQYFKERQTSGVFHFGGHAEWTENTSRNDYTLTGCLILEEEADKGREETVIHASEICDLDLRHLQLVVLNTCSSLRSQNVNRGGPMGLARAFVIAGVPCVIATHTTVRGEAAVFATSFYDCLHKGETIASSFTQALRATAETEIFSNPERWGSFVLFGNDELKLELMSSSA